MALYRNNAGDAYEALKQASFIAGTCAIEASAKEAYPSCQTPLQQTI